MRRTRSRRRNRLFVAAATLVLGLVVAHRAGADAPTATTQPAVAPVTLPPIETLHLEPASLTLADARDGRQALVWGVAADGRKFDLTGEATFEAKSANLSISDGRYVYGKTVGDGEVVISAAGRQATLPVKVTGAENAAVRFGRDVMPVLASAGCNAGLCHGSAAGKNGFKLSLRGYDLDYDYQALVNDLQGRRVDRVQPDKSLMLLKPTGVVPHEGKKAFDVGSRPYLLIHQWIAEGVRHEPDVSGARPNRLEVIPPQIELDLPGRGQRMIVVAHYPDGTSRDVTRDAVLTASNIDVAEVKASALTGLRRGESAVLARYEGTYATVNVTVMGDRAGFAWKPMPERNFIDRHVNAKLQKMKVLPSEECTDADFLRRVYLDLTGVVPSATQARAFLDDATPSAAKREKLVDSLIGSRDFVAYWSNKWADLLQCNAKSLGEKGVWAYREWIRQSVATNKPYDVFARELITAQGSSLESPAVNYFRALKDKDDAGKPTPNKMTEDISQTFLGVRFNCNKCHDHPFEKWTQNQYYEFGAFFARVAFKPGGRPGEEVVFTSFTGGESKHPKTDGDVKPRVPYGADPAAAAARSRQEAFARWLTSRENPLFARSFANRTWSYFLGRGIIDPVDDIRASNPPSNPELLDALTESFIASNFDVRALMRQIVLSRTYQASVVSNDWNVDDTINFSHAIPRRLSAEQMMDAVAIATGTKPRVPGLPEDMRSVYLADGMAEGGGSEFLKLFGRPKRESACECERTSNVSLAHALNLINGPLISGAVSEGGNAIAKLVEKDKDNRRAVEEIYLMTLSRLPSEAELAVAGELGEGAKRAEVAQDLAWALLNSPAFLFNR